MRFVGDDILNNTVLGIPKEEVNKAIKEITGNRSYIELTVGELAEFIKSNDVKENEVIYIETNKSNIPCEVNQFVHSSYISGKQSLIIRSK